MRHIVIDEVLVNDEPPGDLTFAIDTPVAGATSDGYLIRVQGWALGAEILAVSAYDVGTLLVQGSEWRARPDVDADGHVVSPSTFRPSACRACSSSRCAPRRPPGAYGSQL